MDRACPCRWACNDLVGGRVVLYFLLFNDFKKIGGFDDGNAAAWVKHEQIGIPGDNEFGARGNRAVDDLVVFGVPAKVQIGGIIDKRRLSFKKDQEIFCFGGIDQSGDFWPVKNTFKFCKEITRKTDRQ